MDNFGYIAKLEGQGADRFAQPLNGANAAANFSQDVCVQKFSIYFLIDLLQTQSFRPLYTPQSFLPLTELVVLSRARSSLPSSKLP